MPRLRESHILQEFSQVAALDAFDGTHLCGKGEGRAAMTGKGALR